MEEIIEAVGSYAESVDMLLKAIADDDRTAFIAAISMVGVRRVMLDGTVEDALLVA